MVIALDEVVLAEYGNGNPRRVGVVGAQCSWELSGVGSFSAFARLADLRAAGLAGDIKDFWLVYRSRAGTWGGVVSGRPINDGVCELSGEGWASLLRGKVITEWDRPAEGPAAALVKRAMMAAGEEDDLWISFGERDESGDPVLLAIGGQDLLEDVLLALADQTDLDWLVDEARVLHLGTHLGRDQSARLRLVEGRHIVSYQLADDIWAATPDDVWVAESVEDSLRTVDPEGPREVRTVSPGISVRATRPPKHKHGKHERPHRQDSYPKRHYAREHDKPHHDRDKRRRGRGKGGGAMAPGVPVETVTWVPVPPPWSLAAPGVGAMTPAIRSGALMPPPTTPLELTVVNTDDVWSRLGLGDTVRVDIGSAGLAGRFRVMVLGLDVAAGELTVSGEVMPDEEIG